MCCGRTREHSPTEHQSIRILGAHQNKCKGELSSLPALNATRAKLHVRLLPLQMYNHSSGTHLQSSFVDATCSRVRYLTKSTTQKVSFQSPDTSRTRKTWVHVHARSSVDSGVVHSSECWTTRLRNLRLSCITPRSWANIRYKQMFGTISTSSRTLM